MKYLYAGLAGLWALSPWYAQAVEFVMSAPNAAVTLPIEGSKGSSFYTVDGDRFNVIVAFTVGPEDNEQLVRQVIQLMDGQTYRVSIGGFALDTKATTISLTRKDQAILAKIVSCESRETMANCL
ncbi:MAG: hypothetical protein P8163_02730 [Candidatus Thiodiazotropha sp.]